MTEEEYRRPRWHHKQDTGSRIYRGRLAPKNSFFTALGSLVTPTGVMWSNEEADLHERVDREERGW